MRTKLNSINPSDASSVWEGFPASRRQVEQAVTAARAAFVGWSATPLEERIHLLRQFGEALGRKREELAVLIAREIGKPHWEARTEVAAMIGKIEISIKAYRERCGEFSNGKASTRFRPHGVLAVLGPYNFPGHLPNGHICPALLAGNTVLFKPSELAPATAEFTGACWREAGLPENVLQILQGGASTAKTLVANPGIDGVLFTGSAATGNLLARRFAKTPGRILALEMGGNNPLIVDSGHITDLSAAVEITLQSAFLSAGQRCTCARRLILVESRAAGDFLESLVRRTTALRVDDPFADPPPFMGPLASPSFPARIIRAQEMFLEAGAIALLKSTAQKPGTGFVTPGIIDVTGVPDLPDEEVFGPLLQIIRVADLDAAIEAANATRYGLAAGILTDADERYQHSFPRLRAGIINRNQPLTGASSAAPFGGIRDSGNLRPSAFFAADYCAYPVASMEVPTCVAPPVLP